MLDTTNIFNTMRRSRAAGVGAEKFSDYFGWSVGSSQGRSRLRSFLRLMPYLVAHRFLSLDSLVTLSHDLD